MLRSVRVRAAFHHEMLAVEKIRGVAFVERKRLESRERLEGTGRSTPSRSRAALRLRTRCAPAETRSPATDPSARNRNIHVPAQARLPAEVRLPRDAIRPRSAVSCRPIRVGAGLGVAHVDRPVERQRDFFEHAAQQPAIAGLLSRKPDARCPARFQSQSSALHRLRS